MSKPEQEHGTKQSYVIGFILSLIFTLIPYYLVVNQSLTGNALLVTILGFAVAQMIIQITFFLHIGRGPKPNWNLFFFAGTVGIVLVVVGGSIVIINNLHYNMQPSDQTKKIINDEGIYQVGGELTGACQGQYTNHQVIIKNGQVSPVHTYANKCDTLTFINQDSEIRDIAFGSHPQHLLYAGESELTVRKGVGKTITLSDSGTYLFHDHLHEETAGEFTVSQ
ncbi:MAG TPA: cytochrome o ubiquinol oxidase subunit IV [Candidatus Saccharimonadales bacterium]|nr:cytochrome o ubiquinol oxidase subunit IV [Candidatus Saccharimonadales bacterium]